MRWDSGDGIMGDGIKGMRSWGWNQGMGSRGWDRGDGILGAMGY